MLPFPCNLRAAVKAYFAFHPPCRSLIIGITVMSIGPGSTIGPFKIQSLLGKGGMGEVFSALDTRLDRKVALKILPTDFVSDPDRLRRFRSEARTLASLNHPNVLVIHEVGAENSNPYLVSELLEGRTLREELAGGALPLRKAIDYALQIANGLAAAHARDILHRDLKPENIFITKDARVKILDFGLAKPFLNPESTIRNPQSSEAPTLLQSTLLGLVLGTPAYMSPEQVRGEPADQRSDIFAFGCVFHEMLAGTSPFKRATAVESMNAVLRDAPPDLNPSAPNCPPLLERTIYRCLEKEPANRFQSANDLAFALEFASQRSPSGTHPVASVRGWSWKAAAALSAIGCILGGFILGFLLNNFWSPARPSTVPSIRYFTYSGRDYSPAVSPDGKRVCFASDRMFAADRTGTKRIWIKEISSGLESPLTSGPDDYPRFSPDGSSILFTRANGAEPALFRVPSIGGEPSKILAGARFGDWSPDGRRIAFVRWPGEGGSIIGVANVDGSGEAIVHQTPDLRYSAPRWSPGGQTLALSANERGLPQSLVIIDVPSGKARSLPAAHPYNVLSGTAWQGPAHLIWAQGESATANSVGSTAAFFRQNVRSGTIQKILWSPVHTRTLEILPNGNLLLDSRSSRENLKEYSLHPGAAPPVSLTLGNSTDRQPCYSPSGDEIVFSSNRSGNLEIWSFSRKTGVVRRLTDNPADDWDPAFSPDGKKLIWSSARSGNLEVWMANSDGSAPRQITRNGFAAENPTITPDGSWIVYGSTHPESSGITKIRPDGTDAKLLAHGSNLGNAEVSPDGKYAAYLDEKLAAAPSIKVVEVESGAIVPFEIQVPVHLETTVVLGRSRWMPDGKALVFVGQNEAGVNGLFIQDFVPGQDTSGSRRQLAGFDPENSAESFGISPDGKFVTIATWEQFFSIMITEGLE